MFDKSEPFAKDQARSYKFENIVFSLTEHRQIKSQGKSKEEEEARSWKRIDWFRVSKPFWVPWFPRKIPSPAIAFDTPSSVFFLCNTSFRSHREEISSYCLLLIRSWRETKIKAWFYFFFSIWGGSWTGLMVWISVYLFTS